MLTIELRFLISSDLSPTDVSSANNLYNPSISSAMSLMNIKNNRRPLIDPWGTLSFKLSFNEMVSLIITCSSQLMQYSRVCCSYYDFINRWLLLILKLLNQGYLVAKLKPSLQKFYRHHYDLVNRYVISVSHMTHMFRLS